MYKLINDRDNVARNVKRENEDGSETYIPFAETNTDYQKYLEWLADGNEPLPADEGNE